MLVSIMHKHDVFVSWNNVDICKGKVYIFFISWIVYMKLVEMINKYPISISRYLRNCIDHDWSTKIYIFKSAVFCGYSNKLV